MDDCKALSARSIKSGYMVFPFFFILHILGMGKFWRLAPMWVAFLTKEESTIESIRVLNLDNLID
jgi:hypothetical protein